jgi:hypothetical protein
VPRHDGWLDDVQAPQTEGEVAALRRCAERCTPFGSAAWVERTAERLGLQSSLHSAGRPAKCPGPPTEYGGLFPPEVF